MNVTIYCWSIKAPIGSAPSDGEISPALVPPLGMIEAVR